MAKKKKCKFLPLIIFLLVLVVLGGVAIYGYNKGWFENLTSFFVPTQNIVNLNQNANPTLTCSQKAQQNNAYYSENYNDAKTCLSYAKLDCQDKGKVIDGYVLDGDCCIYTCSQIIQTSCIDTDGGQDDQFLTRGTVNSNVGTFNVATDECNWDTGWLNEYYCGEGNAIAMTTHDCENWVCDNGACVQPLCEDIMNAQSQADCDAGYTTDGGICSYWNLNGEGQCLSSFNLL
jgi:hypothetical protein